MLTTYFIFGKKKKRYNLTHCNYLNVCLFILLLFLMKNVQQIGDFNSFSSIVKEVHSLIVSFVKIFYLLLIKLKIINQNINIHTYELFSFRVLCWIVLYVNQKQCSMYYFDKLISLDVHNQSMRIDNKQKFILLPDAQSLSKNATGLFPDFSDIFQLISLVGILMSYSVLPNLMILQQGRGVIFF